VHGVQRAGWYEGRLGLRDWGRGLSYAGR
jgi:hypothetical protein